MSYSNCTFSFKFETQEKILKLIHNLDCNKGTQQYDIPINLLKEIVRFSHTYYTTTSIILYLIVFPNSPKKADITPVFKKDEKFWKITDLLASCQVSEKCMSVVYASK